MKKENQSQTSKEVTKKIKINLSIPFRSIGSLVILLGVAFFGIITFIQCIIPKVQEIVELGDKISFQKEIEFIWFLLIAYFLISMGILFLARIFCKLKSFQEKGLFWGLVWGVCFGLFLGLIFYLVKDQIVALFPLMAIGLFFGFVVGLFLELN